MARKKGMQFIPYDYEAAYNKALEEYKEYIKAKRLYRVIKKEEL